MSETVLEARNLTRDYGRLRALDSLDLAVPRSTVLALLGPNGAGKSTFLNLAAGLIEPTAGEIDILGRPSRSLPATTARRVICTGENRMPPHWATASRIIALHAAVTPGFDTERAAELVTSRGIALERPFRSLSKGQRNWILAVVPMAGEAAVLLLDEPADGLDPAARRDLFDLVRGYVNDRDATAIVATHIINDIERVADEVAFLDKGRILLADSLERLREQVVEIEMPSGAPAPDFAGEADVIARQDAAGTRVLWVRCRNGSRRDIEKALPPLAAVRAVSLEHLYLALFGAQYERNSAPDTEKES